MERAGRADLSSPGQPPLTACHERKGKYVRAEMRVSYSRIDLTNCTRSGDQGRPARRLIISDVALSAAALFLSCG